MTLQQLIQDPHYRAHHSALCRGYVSRKSDGIIKPYNGKFGVGYVHLSPRWDSCQYVTITYYVRTDMANKDKQ